MVDEKILRENLSNTLKETDFEGLGELYHGKVRDNYIQKDKGRRILIASDRLSAFDSVITTIPFKGQLLSQMSNFWFKKTEHLVPNHVIEVPDPNVTVAKECDPFPIEMVIRGYITGSAWRDYQKGKPISGIKLPEGLKKNQKLSRTIITPSTKAEKGDHDEPISREEILEKGIVDRETYEKVEKYTYDLFKFGQEFCARNNLILVDCKYEFGKTKDGEIILIDEIHTPDSSRFWIRDTYQDKFDNGEEPEILDKEFFRGWLMEQGYMGDGEIPDIPGDIRIKLAQRYIRSYETITGEKFEPAQGNIKERIKKNLNF